MARKAVQGYTEKSYYENTEFRQTVATSDPLTEGSFAMICNLDIADTGKSVKPRKGFITTTFKNNENNVVNLSTKIIYFKDNKSLKHIVIDLDNFATNAAHLVDISSYNIDKGLLKGAQPIENYDIEDLKNLFVDEWGKSNNDEKVFAQTVFKDSTIVSDITSKSILDINGVSSYIFKLKYSNSFSYYLKVYYNLKDDKLVLSLVDTEEQTRTVNPSLRNLASSKSLIPNPIRYIETDPNIPGVTEAHGLPVLIKTIENKYLTTQIPEVYRNNLAGLTLEPTFYLQEPSKHVSGTGTNKWAFRWDIIKMADANNPTVNKVIYQTPWRTLDTLDTPLETQNKVIDELIIKEQNERNTRKTYIMVVNYDLAEYSQHSMEYKKRRIFDYDKTISEIDYDENVKYVGANVFESFASNAYEQGDILTLRNATSFGDFSGSSVAEVNQMLQKIYDDPSNNTSTFNFFQRNRFNFIAVDELASLLDESVEDVLNKLNTKSKFKRTGTHYPHNFPSSDQEIDTPYIEIPEEVLKKVKFYDINALHKSIHENVKNNITISIVPLLITASFRSELYDQKSYLYMDIRNVLVDGYKAHANDDPVVSNTYLAWLIDPTIQGDNFVRPQDWWDLEIEDRFQAIIFYQTSEQLLIDDVLYDFNNLSIQEVENTLKNNYNEESIFSKGLSILLYLKPYNEQDLYNIKDVSNDIILIENSAWSLSSFTLSGTYTWQYSDKPEYINEFETDEHNNIQESKNFIIFKDRLIVYHKNFVYMSEEGTYNIFLNKLKFEFTEEVLKVIEFKTILLVFTTQHLYAIYEKEFTRLEEETVSPTEEGKAPTTRTKEVKYNEWVKQPVLYNISTSRKYLKTIQVFNQMVLFYSNEGQLYMIKPSTTIDSETQFSIQYFNKSANNIFANYDEYINQRLLQYAKITSEDFSDFITKDDVEVNAIMDIDKIIITYSVSKRGKEITMFLVYDVVNNRYIVYDTLSFSGIVQPDYIDNGYLYVTQDTQATYFTMPYLKNNNTDENVDLNFANGLQKKPIYTLLDTGVIDLNNHLMKRFKEFYITLKNLDATNILYNVEVVIDDVVIKNFYAPSARVIMSNGPDETLTIDKATEKELNEIFGLIQTFGVSGSRDNIESYELFKENFYEDNKLLKLETINSNKMIEYKTQILGRGKSLRLRIQFISKGDYKLQSYGIVYKERRV